MGKSKGKGKSKVAAAHRTGLSILDAAISAGLVEVTGDIAGSIMDQSKHDAALNALRDAKTDDELVTAALGAVATLLPAARAYGFAAELEQTMAEVAQSMNPHGLTGDQMKALRESLHGKADIAQKSDWNAGVLEALEADFGKAVVDALQNPQNYGMLFCRNQECRALLDAKDPNVKYCPLCGSEVEVAAAENQPAAETGRVNCHKCGESVTAGSYCERCKAKLTKGGE